MSGMEMTRGGGLFVNPPVGLRSRDSDGATARSTATIARRSMIVVVLARHGEMLSEGQRLNRQGAMALHHPGQSLSCFAQRFHG